MDAITDDSTTLKRRFFLIVLDGCGAGEMPDALDYGVGDIGSNTLANTARAVGGLQMPALAKVGWGNITPLRGVPLAPNAPALWGRLAEVSKGKDTVTGHWEMVGIRTDVPFPTYPGGFPPEIIGAFEKIVGTKILGNLPASGTEILKRLGEEHLRTGFPIVYTSADSVFQVAAHEDVSLFGLERLYRACEAARRMLREPHHVGRVIARPFIGDSALTFQRTENRRDYPLPLPHDTVLDLLTKAGKTVHAIGKISEIFGGQGITTAEKTTNNPDHIAALARAVRGEGPGGDSDFVFANLEDFDMLYGHRNDPVNFARLLREFDDFVGADLLPHLRAGDLVGITADHGNDPTTTSTDHSREYVPLLAFGPAITQPCPLGNRATFADWGATIAAWLGASLPPEGDSFLPAGTGRPVQ
ncbi:MAG: phosphopentomutase [Cytophagales bacterium]|nr:phosphopentomutase [Armatimonadota bacterium]